MNNVLFLQDLAIVMTTAGAAALVCQWLKQPKVVGYIIAGLLTGPHILPQCLVAETSVMTLADLGLIFMMLYIGFEFNFRKLTAVGATAFVTAIIDVVFMFWLGFVVGRLMELDTKQSVFLGAVICSSSTAVVAQMLNELGQLKERYSAVIVGTTIIEDLAAVVLIAIVTAIGISGAVQPGEVALRLGELVTFLVVVILGGVLVVRRCVNYVAGLRNDEMLALVVLAVCLAVSLLAARLHFSLALGSFIIGAVLAETRSSDRLALFIQPLRSIFAPMFFVAIGMQIVPIVLVQHTGTILLVAAAVILGKLACCSFGAFISGNDRETSFRVGCGMAQICEFALIIAVLGKSLNVMNDTIYSICVTVSVITVFTGSHLLKWSGEIFKMADAATPRGILKVMAVYTRWLGNVKSIGVNAAIRKTVRRSVATMLVNLVLITAVFITVTLLSRFSNHLPFSVPERFGGVAAMLWLCGALATIPLYVATIRKLQAMAMLAAELKFPMDAEDMHHHAIARVLSEKAIVFAGIVALGIFTLMLSSALLPPFPVLLIMLVILGAITAILWKFQIRVYSKAQGILRQTFSESSAPLYIEPLTAIPYIFEDARLSSVIIAPTVRAAGRTISELSIRKDTGATIIGIERGGLLQINPEPDATLMPSDKILLLGTQSQLQNACRLLSE
jgi:monovalent cation:H+ antiporter-2, CPA2 family